jgi:hypothetical protein
VRAILGRFQFVGIPPLTGPSIAKDFRISSHFWQGARLARKQMLKFRNRSSLKTNSVRDQGAGGCLVFLPCRTFGEGLSSFSAC